MTRGRIGTGHDLHRLVPGHALTLGGVAIPSAAGFATRSDGDVLAHALEHVDSLVTLGTVRLGPRLDAMREGRREAASGTVSVLLSAA